MIGTFMVIGIGTLRSLRRPIDLGNVSSIRVLSCGEVIVGVVGNRGQDELYLVIDS